jgi:hypothetical protein
VLLTCCLPSPCGRLSRPRTTRETPSRESAIRRRWTCPVTHQGDTVAVPTFTDFRVMGTVPSYTPAASPHTRRSMCAATVEPSACGTTERMRDRISRIQHCASPYPPDWSWLTNRRASDAGSLSLHLPILLARPRRLAVPPHRYVVRAASGLACISTFDLPSASRDRCIGRGRNKSSRHISASWRTADLIDDEHPVRRDAWLVGNDSDAGPLRGISTRSAVRQRPTAFALRGAGGF